VLEQYPQQTNYEITNIDSDTLQLFINQRLLSDEMRAAIEKVLSIKGEIASIDSESTRLSSEKKSLFENQTRLRENLKSLGGSAEEKGLRSRYIEQLQGEEDRVNAIDAQLKTLADKKAAAQSQLDSLIKNLALEYKVR